MVYIDDSPSLATKDKCQPQQSKGKRNTARKRGNTNHNHQGEEKHPRARRNPKARKNNTTIKGRKRTPQGGQKSQTAKTQTPTTTTRTKATAQTEQKPQSGKQKNIYHNHQKKNTPGRVEATGAPKNKYQKQQPASKDNCQPTKKRETQQTGHHQH